MKKTLCILLSLLLVLLTVLPVLAETVNEEEVYPTIIVAGYSSSSLYMDNGESELGEKIWGVNPDEILAAVLSNLAQLGRGLGELAFKRPEYLVDVAGQAIVDMYGDMAYNPDGTSMNPIRTYFTDPLRTQFSYLYGMCNGENVHEAVIMDHMAEVYGEDGYDQIFSYQNDFRQNIVDCAADLDRYVDAVCEYTGKDKVNIYAVSHGGETTSVYLSLYGKDKGKINNAVLTVPAIGGAALAYDVVNESVSLDEETLMYFIENGQLIEEDYNWLVRAHQLGFLDDICNLLVHRYVKQILGYWGSMWDFIPADYYDELRDRYLDPEKNATLIEKSDYYHHEILPKMSENLQACVDNGMNIYIVAGTGAPSVTGLQEQSDAIITVKSSTGAKTAPWGKRFSDGYRQEGTNCADPTHNHLSPEMTIDASCGYLPEYTWYVNGLYHGMTWRDEYSIALCTMLLFSPTRVDVHTYPEYPQFKYSENRTFSALAEFDKSAPGYWSSEDTKLIVKNLSFKYKMRLISIVCNGVDIEFNTTKPIYIAPQKTVEISFAGDLPAQSLITADLTVNYMMIGSITPYSYRTMTFTVMNGEPAPYNADEPLTDMLHPTDFDVQVSDSVIKVFQKTGVLAFMKMLINSLLTIISTLRMFNGAN